MFVCGRRFLVFMGRVFGWFARGLMGFVFIVCLMVFFVLVRFVFCVCLGRSLFVWYLFCVVFFLGFVCWGCAGFCLVVNLLWCVVCRSFRALFLFCCGFVFGVFCLGFVVWFHVWCCWLLFFFVGFFF